MPCRYPWETASNLVHYFKPKYSTVWGLLHNIQQCSNKRLWYFNPESWGGNPKSLVWFISRHHKVELLHISGLFALISANTFTIYSTHNPPHMLEPPDVLGIINEAYNTFIIQIRGEEIARGGGNHFPLVIRTFMMANHRKWTSELSPYWKYFDGIRVICRCIYEWCWIWVMLEQWVVFMLE